LSPLSTKNAGQTGRNSAWIPDYVSPAAKVAQQKASGYFETRK